MAIALDYALIFELFFDIIAAGEAGMTLSMLVCQEILSLANLFILYDLLLFDPFTFFRFSRLYRKLHTKPAEPIRFSLILECMVCLVPVIFIAIRFLELISYLVQYIL